MDYKYIEQLLERYWECETSEAEESILRTFFSQKDIPAELKRYEALFKYEQREAEVHRSNDFDQRVLAAIGLDEPEPAIEAPFRQAVKAKRITLSRRLQPLYRAAAAVAIVTLLGTAAQHSFTSDTEHGAWDYNQSAYKDSYEDPQKAYEAGMEALQMFKEGPQTAVADTMPSNRSLKK